MGQSRQIIFVCTGNTCRSPMAEYLLRRRLGQKSDWQVSSAGVAAVNGWPASQSAVDALAELQIDLSPHRSRMLTREMVDKARWIVVMTQAHAHELLYRFSHAADRTRLLTSFAGTGHAEDIEDPIGGSLATYRCIRDKIDEYLPDLAIVINQESREKS